MKKSLNFGKNFGIRAVIAPMLFVAFGLFGVNEAAWGKTFTWKVTVGVASGKGTATAEVIKCPLLGSESTEKSCSSTSTTTSSTYATESHTFASSNTNRKYKFSASASTGYSFAGWYTSTSVSGTASSTSNPLTGSKTNSGFDETRYAKFTPNEYTVTYDAKGGSVSPGSKKVTFDGTYGSLATPTKTGYTFDGWYTAASGGTQVTSSTKVSTASNHTIYAHWTANTYYVAFNGNGATSGSMSNQEFTYDAAAKALTANSYGRQYTVSYNANGGTATTNATNTTATYTFKNWNKEADGSGTVAYTNQQTVSNIATSGTLNLYAQWNSDYVKLPNATKDGGVLDAWYLGDVNVDANRVGAAGDNYTPTANVTLTAKWIDKYTPEFGGSDHSMKVGDALANAFTFNHTSNPAVHISPAGIITYDATTNKVTAVGAGTATIYFTQAGTSTILPGESDHWTFTVTRVANTLALTSTSASKYVEEEVTGIITTKNSDATVQTSSSDATIAYYDVANNKIVIPNSEAKSFTSTTVTITIWQAQTVKYEASGEKVFTLTVNKYPTSFSGSNYNMMVDGTQVANYAYTNTSAVQPTADSNDDFYYTVDEVTFTNSDKNKGNSLLMFDPSNKQITAKNAGSAKITLHQKETYKHTGATKSFNVAVYKYNSVFANANNLDVKVEANVTSGYTLSYVKPDNTYISTESLTAGTPSLNSGDFYYTLSHNVTTSNTTGSSDATKVIDYVASTKKATGKNEGTTTVHLYQTETYKYKAAEVSFIVTVAKNDPVFTWKAGPYYHNSTVNGIFSSTNTDFAATIGESTDALVARVDGNTLHVLSKNGTADFTVTQAANYKWNSKEVTYTVTPTSLSNHVPFTYSQAMYDDNDITTQKSSSAWDGGVRLGGASTSITGAPAYNWDDKYIVVYFYGIPDKLSFSYKTNSGAASDADWSVQESTNGSSWTDVWAEDNKASTSWTSVNNQQLKTTTRYLRFCYSGNFAGYFKDIKVTELKRFNGYPTTLDFGAWDINETSEAQTFNFNYANAGHHVTLSVDDDHFTVSPSVITNVGGEKVGKEVITVSYKTTEIHKNTNAKLTISDELGHSATVTLKGETRRLTPTVTWIPDETTFNVDDVLTAINANELDVTLSVEAEDASYIECSGNAAVMLAPKSGTVTVTAHVTGNDIYADADITKEITITNKTKQYITWEQDFSRLKINDATKSITLNATSSSGLPVTYELQGDKTGVSLTQNGNTWTLTYSATECKNTTIVAKQAGNDEYAPASKVTLSVKVIDPTKECDGLVAPLSDKELRNTSFTVNVDIPQEVTIQVERSNTDWYATYTQGFDVEFYSGVNGTGNKIGDTHSRTANQINPTSTIVVGNLDRNIKSIKLISHSLLYSYTVTNLTYKQHRYCELSTNALSFETSPNTITSAKTFDVNHANYPISLECNNSKFSFSPEYFGDCLVHGKQKVSVTYTAGPDEGTDNGILYIKDNTGKTLGTVTLSVSITQVDQSIKSHNIQQAYKTTDLVTLTAETNSGLSDFTFTATPSDIVTVNGNELTFSKSGTISVTVSEPGSNVYRPTSTTVNNIVVSKDEPYIATAPTGAPLVYQQTLQQSILNGGAAEVTFRGIAHTAVEGTFAWTNPLQQIAENTGVHNYSVTFTPTNSAMYTTKTFTIPINISRAEQSILMNNGEVKVAVEGLDAGSEDAFLDLDDLINWQTSHVVNDVERTGSVSYEVISANKETATIAVGNIFSATQTGEYTIRATKAQTDYYSEATADFTVTVGKRANTLVVSGTAFERFVDEEVTAVRSVQNSDAQVQTSSTSPTIAFYDVDNNKIVIPNSESEEQMFGSHKTVTIKIWQEATDRFEASGEKTITLTVKKYVTTITGTDQAVKVNSTKTADYAFVNTVTAKPSSNLSDDFYYTIDEPNFENAALNNGDELITFNSNTNVISGLNAGTTKITFYHKETRKYTGTSLICNIAVEKKANEISNSWNVWQKDMNESASANVSFSSTRGGYANSPIAIERVYGEEVAAMSGDASGATITTNTTHGYAIWHLSQAENYEYYAAEADLMVTVGVPAPPTCYVYEDNSEHEFMTHITDAEGHFETPIAINSPIDKIWYSAKKSSAGYNYFAVQYSTDNGKTWSAVSSPDLGSDYVDYSASFPAMSGNKKITHVRFGAKTGATLSKWYKNVKISRKSYFNIQDAEQKNISSLPTMMCTVDESSTATAKFYLDYSTCAEEITLQSSNPEHFTVSRTKIDITANSDNANSAKEEITVTYNSAELGTHNAVITIKTEYQTRALSVSGETTKRTPTLTWQEGFTNNPLTLPIGLTVSAVNQAAVSTSPAAVMYESSNESVIEITDNGYGFRVIGLGSATLTAIVPENDKWKSVSDTRVVHATEKTVQEIVWDQSFPRFMQPEDVIDLDAKVYLRQISTNTLTYSSERTANIIYSCPVNNVVAISGNKMTILDYGEVKVTASVSGNANYEAAVPVIMLINVRQPSVGCETPLVVNIEDVIDMFEVNVDFSNYSSLTTQEMISDEIAINPAQGKPDKLSFSYGGEAYKVPVINTKLFGGVIKFEQRVNSQWRAVTNSRVETVQNEWNTQSNLQLDENATALRIIRESGATGHHKLKDIQVTRKQYLRATQLEIDLGEVVKGETKSILVGFDYSDIKGDLTARTINETSDVTIKDNGAIDLECGSFGHYDLPVTFTPSAENDNWEGTIEIYDNIANLSTTVALKAKVTIPDSEEFIFNKEGEWSDNANWTTNLVPGADANITIAQDVTINTDANVKSMTIEEGFTVTVQSGVTLRIGNGTEKNLGAYGNLHIEEGANVILDEEGHLTVNDFTLEAQLGDAVNAGASGQVLNSTSLEVRGNAYFDVALDPTGECSQGWYDFTVPFPVDAMSGVSRFDNSTHEEKTIKNEVNYAIMDYSESRHLATGYGWKKFRSVMQPGQCYSITIDDVDNVYRFKKTADGAINVRTTDDLMYTETDDAARGWNCLGNGTLAYANLSAEGIEKVQVYSHSTNSFTPVSINEFTYVVGSAFMIQAIAPNKQITYSNEGDMNTLRAPRRSAAMTEFALSLTREGSCRADDRLYVSADEAATYMYEIGRELTKFGNPADSKVAQVWANAYGQKLCDIEMPLVGDDAECAISFYAPKAGTYTFAVDRAVEETTLYLTYNGDIIWNLSESAYTLDLPKGTTEGYGLRVDAKRTPQIATGCESLNAEGQRGNRKVMIDQTIYIVTPEGAMYDLMGNSVK